jgi:hypothetical protein
MKHFDKNYLLILIAAILLMLPLANNLYFYGHDTGYHIANIIAISKNLSFNNLLNLKILPIIAGNFGYGACLFYPELSHIIAAFIYKIFNLTVFNTLKITDFLIILLSGIFMYKFMKTITKNNKLSLISTLFYITAPYKLYDLFVRDSLAESFIFIFIPLVFLSVYYLLNNEHKKFYLSFVIGYVGLINSHLVMSIYVTIFLSVILLINFKKIWNKKTMMHFIIATITVLLICLPFIIPLLTHKFNGSYVVFEKDAMANRFGVHGNGLNPLQYFVGTSKSGYHFINIVLLILVIYLIRNLKKLHKLKELITNDYLFCVGFVCAILGLWMSSLAFPWFIMPNTLLMIQFPWRLGTLSTFGLSILSFYALDSLKTKQNTIIILSVISCLIVSLFCIYNQEYSNITTDDYDLSTIGMGWQYEYLPVNTNNNIDYFNNRSNEVLASDDAKVKILEDNTPYLKFSVETDSQTTLELPRLYYIGYQIKAIYNDGEEILDYKENDNGFIEINISKDAIIEVDYQGTIPAKIGNKISIITIFAFLVLIIFKRGDKVEKRSS